MAKNSWKDYLTFTKGERISVFIMLTILLLSIFVPYFYARTFKPPVVDTVLQKHLDSVLGNIQEDSATSNLGSTELLKESNDSIKLFYFDPNTLDAAGFKQLGLKIKQFKQL
jgi:hypothetical protein